MSSDQMEVDPVENPKEEVEEEIEEQHHNELDEELQEKDQKKLEKKKFEIRKWTAVAFWSWDMVVENCAICRNHLMEQCIECQPNSMSQTNGDCITAWGQCNHAFHLHCITRWLKTRNVCPLDNREWVLQRYGK